MATLSASKAGAGVPVTQPQHGVLCVAYGTYELAANPTAADIIEFCKLPAGAVVVGGTLYGDDLDTNVSPELDIDIGWADDTDGFLNSGAYEGAAVAQLKPEAGIMVPLFGTLKDGPVSFAAETTIIGTVNVDAATGGTGTISLVLYYTMPVA
jgi:hypothetical protein